MSWLLDQNPIIEVKITGKILRWCWQEGGFYWIERYLATKVFLEGGKKDGEARKDSYEFGLGPVTFKMFSTHLFWLLIL